ncbi:Stk1 family PASTA domain-containing Ser/Thr kinase [Ornithinimicrobium sufpigmenti]|uniref:Stk1 family PASTA domain-containing Ser/Thr kinase n=1 Tax=Ornithinimicrobium sufpigmenti TaxID=2508882 RepID=UPI001035EA28|nr:MULTISPECIES: Stk1 family PASTA domain-containing Ser/Thr kinase [unclassified Ornithinimicrobium]
MSDEPTEATPTPPQQDPRLLGGRYEIGELVGRGGMADVHLGHDLRLGRTVAIKILRTDLARDSSFLSRFRREAQAAAGLSHPSIVAVFDSGEEIVEESGGAELHVPYIVMEYIEGKTLREVLNDKQSLDPEEASRITATVLSAMHYAHERGLVHRDIKPANVMVTEAGAVKVMDFGIARALADTAATMTQTQAVMGTARYLSPEQAQGLDVDGRSDLYSVGCLLYELLAGRTPFQGDPVSLVYQHLGEAPKVPSTHRPVPEELDAITVHALEKRPEDRYQDADDFRADLNAFRAGEPVSEAATASLQSVLAATGGAGGAVTGGVGAAAVAHATQPVARSQSQGDRGRYGDPLAGMGTGGASHDDDRYERTDELPVRERRHPGAVLLLGAMSLLAVAGLAWVLYLVLGPGGDDGPPMVAVPSTVGSTEAAARTQLVGLGFVVPEARFEEDEQPAGTVIDQLPLTGEAPEGSDVRLVVSSGPAALAIPPVQGMEERAARARLERAGFTNVREQVEEEDDPDWAEGEVIDTTPAAGNQVGRDQEIVLTVSSGQVEVPDVVGETRDAAVLALFQQSLRYEMEDEPNADVEPGTVLRQSVEAGEIVEQDTRITLTVAVEPPVPPAPPTTIRETITATPTPTGPEDPTDSEDPTDTDDPTGTDDPTDTEDPTSPEPTEPTSPPDPTGPGNVPPGQGGVPPGQGGTPPGQGGDPPGRGNGPRP